MAHSDDVSTAFLDYVNDMRWFITFNSNKIIIIVKGPDGYILQKGKFTTKRVIYLKEKGDKNKWQVYKKKVKKKKLYKFMVNKNFCS